LPLGKIQCALERTLFAVDLLLELEDGVENSFGTRRASRDVNVNGNNLIAALHDGVIIEDAAGSGASAHGDDPLGLGHLIVKLANDRRHFLGEAPCDDHQIGLTGRGAKNFSAETGEIEAGGGHGHHFNGAASEAEAKRPDRAFAGPVHGCIERGEDDAFVLQEAAEVVGLGERDVFAEGCAHGVLSQVFSHRGSLETNCELWLVWRRSTVDSSKLKEERFNTENTESEEAQRSQRTRRRVVHLVGPSKLSM